MKNRFQNFFTIAIVLVGTAWGLTKVTGYNMVNSVINSTPIGQTSPAAGGFTNLNAGTFQVAGVAPLNHMLCGNGTNYVDSINCGGSPVQCTSDGCYKISSDGTIVEWGVKAGGCSGGACGTHVTFPYVFPSAVSNIQSTCYGQANCLTSVIDIGTAGFTLQYAPLVFVGGSGGNLSGGQQGSWVAIGY